MVIQIQIGLIFDAVPLVLNRDIQFLIAAFEFQIGIVMFDFRFDNLKTEYKRFYPSPHQPFQSVCQATRLHIRTPRFLDDGLSQFARRSVCIFQTARARQTRRQKKRDRIPVSSKVFVLCICSLPFKVGQTNCLFEGLPS